MRKTYAAIITPIISMLILTIGNGLFTTITTLQLKNLQASNLIVGLVGAAYFFGLMVGSYSSQKLITRVGHIRAYATFAAVIGVATLLQGIFALPWAWMILRFLVGYALAGLFIVIESWILVSSEESSKGRMMAFYLLSYYLAQACSQLLLKVPFPSTLVAFCLIAGLATLSIVPVSMTRFAAPELSGMAWVSPLKIYRKAPLGMWASLASGLILGSIYAMYPLFLLQSGLSHSQIAIVMFTTLLGGALLQLPIGKLSDQFDRRKVLVFLALLSAVLALYLVFVHESYIMLLIASFLLGGMSFTIYPLSISHTSDYTSANESVAAVSVLTIFYGLGSGIGPVVVPGFMHAIGANGFFVFLCLISILLGVYAIWRIVKREPPPDTNKREFVAATPEATTMAEDIVK